MSCLYLCKFIAVVALAVSLSQHQNGRKLWWKGVRKNWKTGTKMEVKTEPKCPLKSAARMMSTKRESVASEAKKCVAILGNDHILAFFGWLQGRWWQQGCFCWKATVQSKEWLFSCRCLWNVSVPRNTRQVLYHTEYWNEQHAFIAFLWVYN